MPTSKVTYSGELRTVAVHLASGDNIITDAPADNHGKGQAFSPTDLTSTSLASCMLTTIGIYAMQNGIEMKDSHAEVQKIMSSSGQRRITGVEVKLFFITVDKLEDKEREAFERIARNCPVAISLHPDLQQTITFDYKES